MVEKFKVEIKIQGVEKFMDEEFMAWKFMVEEFLVEKFNVEMFLVKHFKWP